MASHEQESLSNVEPLEAGNSPATLEPIPISLADPPIPEPQGRFSAARQDNVDSIQEVAAGEAAPSRPVVKLGQSFRNMSRSISRTPSLRGTNLPGDDSGDAPPKPTIGKLGKSFRNVKSFRTPSGGSGGGDEPGAPPPKFSGMGKSIRNMKSFRNGAPGDPFAGNRAAMTGGMGKSFRNTGPSGGGGAANPFSPDETAPSQPSRAKSFRKARTVRRSSQESAQGEAPVVDDPKAKMKNFITKFSASTKIYNPTQIEVPEQLVMEQDGMLYVVDLGYTRITISDADVGDDTKLKVWQRCIVALCPCCINGPAAAWDDFMATKAYMTFCFLVCWVDVIVFIVEIVMYGFEPAKVNHMIGPSACGLYKIGAKWTPDIVIRGEVWRLFAPIFLHGGVVHILLNLFAQLTVGFQCEYTWGTAGFTVIYLVSGIVGNILSAIGSPEKLSVGASGAILGLIGGQITHTWVTWNTTPEKLRTGRVRGLIVTLVILVGTGFMGAVDNWVHFGGLVTGAIMGCVMFRSELVYSGWKRYLATSWSIFGSLAIIVLTVVLFWKQRDEFIPEC